MTTLHAKFDAPREQAALARTPVAELHQRYLDLSGERTRSRNRTYLVRRILWLMQARRHGGLSERALALAATLARDCDIRTTAPADADRAPQAPARATHDPRLPRPGRAIVRQYKGETLRVVVLADGFEFAGERYGSLSAIANAVTGSHISGFRFFGIKQGGAR